MHTRVSTLLSAGVRGAFVAVCLGVVGITYWRLWYGIDFTDESFYVAVAYRFAMGARPYVDETTVTQQTTAVMLYPFVRAYEAIAGLTGIVLFVRNLQFVLSLVVAAAVYRTLRSFLDRSLAVPIALMAVVFVPFTIHSVSYDSVGCALLTAGCFLGLRPLVDPTARRARLLSGTCLGIAAFAYPPLLIPVAVCVAARLALTRPRCGRELVEHGLPAIGLPLAGLGILASAAGFWKIVGDYRRSSQFLGQAGGVAKFGEIVHQTRLALPHWYLLPVALVLLAILWRYGRALGAVLLLALPFLVLPSKLTQATTSLDFVAHLGWLAPVLHVLVRRHPGARLLLLVVWLPAFVAGATTAYSSANGAVNFGVGALPAAVVATVYLAWAIEDALRGSRVRSVSVVGALVVLAFLVWADTVPVYRDGGLTSLTARMSSGPYAGLATTPWKQRWINGLSRDLATYRSPCTILFFDNFPAGYLLSEGRPDTDGVWIATVARDLQKPYENQLLGYYRSRHFPDVVVEIRRIPYTRHQGWTIYYRTRSPLVATLQSPAYSLIRWRRPYSIYRRRGNTCTGSAVGSAASGRAERAGTRGR